MSKPHKKSAGAGRKDNGNVVLDLGEKHSQKISKMIDAKFVQAGLAGGQKTEMGRPSSGSKFGGRFLGRPALGAGYRPWYAGRRPWMGNDAGTISMTAMGPRTMFGLIPAHMRQVATMELLTGVGLGILGNRALMRLTPQLWQTNSNPLIHEGIAFAAGLIPLLFKRNATTLGVAIPGAVYLGGMLIDKLFNAVGMPAGLPGMAGANVGNSAGSDAALAARQKLAAIQQRIQAGGGAQRNVPRVVAQPQYA
jgi:hypothetical protein